jgi:hypothetical protein
LTAHGDVGIKTIYQFVTLKTGNGEQDKHMETRTIEINRLIDLPFKLNSGQRMTNRQSCRGGGGCL